MPSVSAPIPFPSQLLPSVMALALDLVSQSLTAAKSEVEIHGTHIQPNTDTPPRRILPIPNTTVKPVQGEMAKQPVET